MKTLRIALLLVLAFTFTAAPLLAQAAEKAKVDTSDFTKAERVTLERESRAPANVTFSGAAVGAGLGAALTIVGAGFGFGRIGAAALESIARQPEMAGRIQTAMIVIAALLEGATFFALIVCILVANNVKF
jgi:F-type H+-transporting ATPase subunit c